MSRLGKLPVEAPKGVEIKVSGQQINVKGPKGALQFNAPEEVKLSLDGQILTVTPRDQSQRARAMWGTTRAVVASHVKGVSEGIEKNLELNGVGYRAAMKGKDLQLQLGLSHDVIYTPPEGVTIAVPKPTEIKITGPDAQSVGQAAAEIRSYRPPEPYKGKGIKFVGEYIRRKEGKKK